jgi:acetyltransferase
MEHLAKLLVNFSQLIVEQPFIKEIDVNPLLIGNDSLITLDARMVLYEADILEEKLTRPAIRPYPNQYKKYATLKEGTQVTIRPIRPEDEPMMVKFQHTLSERSVFMRYVNTISLNQRTSHEWLSRMCFVDYNREIALIVKYKHPETGESEIIAVCHLTKLGGANDAEFAILISDNWQGHGLGKELMQDMLQIGRDEKFRKIIGFIHPDNAEMLRVCKKLGFKQYYSFEEGLNKVELDLNQHHAF